MNMQSFKDLLDKIPLAPIFFVFAAYMGWDYYSWRFMDGHDFAAKLAEVEKAKQDNTAAQKRLSDAKLFFQSLSQKREELRSLATDLEQMKAVLTEDLDIPGFIKLVVTEGKKVGLNVVSIKPLAQKEELYYTEQPFDFQFRGLYVQLVVFMERLAAIERIVRIDNFQIKARSGTSSQFVELEGNIQIKSYRYKGSREDELARLGGSNEVGAGTPKPAGAP